MIRALLRALLVVLTIALVCGCAVGRGPAGEIVVGLDVGRSAETAEEALQAAAGLLPPPWDKAAAALLTVALAGWSAARSRRDGERSGWDEGVASTMPQIRPAA